MQQAQQAYLDTYQIEPDPHGYTCQGTLSSQRLLIVTNRRANNAAIGTWEGVISLEDGRGWGRAEGSPC